MKNDLRDDRGPDQDPCVQPQYGDHGDRGILEDVFEDDSLISQSLRVSRPDIVFAENIERCGAGDPCQVGHHQDSQGDGRENQMLDAARKASLLSHTHGGKEIQSETEQEDEEDLNDDDRSAAEEAVAEGAERSSADTPKSNDVALAIEKKRPEAEVNFDDRAVDLPALGQAPRGEDPAAGALGCTVRVRRS